MTKYKRGYRVIPFRWQTPHHKSVYWFAVQRTVYVFIWTYLFIGEAQCNIPHPFHCQRAKQCGMVLKHCLFCSRFFFFLVICGGQGVLGGQEWSSTEFKGHVYKAAPHTHREVSICLLLIRLAPPEKGLDFCICSKTLLCIFQDWGGLNHSMLFCEETAEEKLNLISMPHSYGRVYLLPTQFPFVLTRR